jgi:glycosyltransferase involved in cell wall biosynthesis
MEIGIITDALDEKKGAGIRTYVLNMVRNLDSKDITLIHYKKNKDKVYSRFKELIIPMRNIPFYREIRKMFVMPCMLNKFDIVHETVQIGPFFFKSRFKKIVTVHDLSVIKFPKSHKGLHYVHHKLGLQRTLKNVDRIIAVSNSTKKDLIRLFKVPARKIKVIYEAADKQYRVINDKKELERFKTRYHIDYPFVLYIGTLEPRKNIPRLIKAFRLVKKKGYPHKLLVVGKKGWKYKAIFKMIKTLGLEKDVVFTGFIEEKELPLFYNVADVFVFPSLYEGFGLPVLEAMQCGCPVIIANNSSLPEITGDAALKVNARDVRDIAMKIERLIKDKNLKIKFAQKGVKHARRFSWKRCAKETRELYKEVLNLK